MVALIIGLLSFLFTSCEAGFEDVFYRKYNVTQRTGNLYELTEEETFSISSLPDEYYIVLFSDIHFGKHSVKTRHEEDFLNWLQDIKENEPEENFPKFCVCLGDIADYGYESEFSDYNDFTKQVEEIFGKKNIIFNTLGNHDLYNDGWNYYKEMIFPYKSFYHFKTENFSWYFIDNASCSVGTSQFNQLEQAIENDDLKKIIFTHIPIYGDQANDLGYFSMQNSHETDKIITLFAKNNVDTVFDGHTHKYYVNDFGKFVEYTVPSITTKNAWTLVKINETAGTVEKTLIKNQ